VSNRSECNVKWYCSKKYEATFFRLHPVISKQHRVQYRSPVSTDAANENLADGTESKLLVFGQALKSYFDLVIEFQGSSRGIVLSTIEFLMKISKNCEFTINVGIDQKMPQSHSEKYKHITTNYIQATPENWGEHDA